jgi:glutamine amidotransferase
MTPFAYGDSPGAGTRVTIFDHGAGNLHSLTKALARAGGDVRVATGALAALDTEVLVLPGVGAFAPAAARLAPGRDTIRRALDNGLPCIGICLGLQLLFDASDEGPGAGLGLIPGRVTRLAAPRLPQIGWNTLEDVSDAAIDAAQLASVYYANSFAGRPTDESVVTAWTTYGDDRFPAVVRTRRTIGVQFHPEKSSEAGIAFLRCALEAVTR